MPLIQPKNETIVNNFQLKLNYYSKIFYFVYCDIKKWELILRILKSKAPHKNKFILKFNYETMQNLTS